MQCRHSRYGRRAGGCPSTAMHCKIGAMVFAEMRRAHIARPPMMRTLRTASLLLVCAGVGRAQCPDGTPPPCRSATVALARRANPAMNARGWVVVPFGNAMRAQELEWLRDGSANLLSLDLG